MKKQTNPKLEIQSFPKISTNSLNFYVVILNHLGLLKGLFIGINSCENMTKTFLE